MGAIAEGLVRRHFPSGRARLARKDPTTVLSGDQISEMGLPEWQAMHGSLEARFATPHYATGRRFVDASVAALRSVQTPAFDARPHVQPGHR